MKSKLNYVPITKNEAMLLERLLDDVESVRVQAESSYKSQKPGKRFELSTVDELYLASLRRKVTEASRAP